MSLEIHVFGPGYGEAIAVKLPDGGWGLVDCFASGRRPDSPSAVLDFLENQGVSKLEFFCWTHPDDDHSSGIPALLQRFKGKLRSIWSLPSVDLREILSYLEAQNRAYFTTDKPGYLVEVYEQLRKLKAASVSIEWLQTNLVLRARTNPDYRILSLAPTPEALQDFAAHLGQCFGAMGVNLQRKHYPLCNDVSSALLIEYAGAQIILGARPKTHLDKGNFASTLAWLWALAVERVGISFSPMGGLHVQRDQVSE